MIDAEIILYRVWAAQCAFAVFLADLMDGHQPKNIHTQVFETRQMGFGCLERPFLGELTGVDLVDNGVLAPLRVDEFYSWS